MAVVVGIDEAGYGPALGPLVVAATVFEVGDASATTRLWRRLTGAGPGDGQTEADCPRIADSKRLYQGDGRLERLERNVLATCPLALPAALEAFMSWLSVPADHLSGDEPWYAEGFAPLPVSADAEIIGRLRERFLTACSATGVELRGVAVNLSHPWRFNRMVAATHNKASALWWLCVELIEAAALHATDGRLEVTIDKHGGRTYYARPLQEAFPLSRVETLAEAPEESRYRVDNGSWVLELTAREKADDSAMPVALASMYAKYVRELFMTQFNRWWHVRAAGVAPTAGYWTDYERWAEEMRPFLSELDLPPEHYIRCR